MASKVDVGHRALISYQMIKKIYLVQAQSHMMRIWNVLWNPFLAMKNVTGDNIR